MHPRFRVLPFAALAVYFFIPFAGSEARAQLAAKDIVQMEVERSERSIKAVRVEIGNRYEKKLAELRAAYQKLGDLEGALAVREEEKRVAGSPEYPLARENAVNEPRLLREAQNELLNKQTEMVTQIVQEALPKLVEMKKSLTIAGKLDEAVEVRAAIQRLQDSTAPAERISNGTQVTAEELYQAYQSSKERADKMYRGVKMSIRGRVAGVRQDPREPGMLTLVLFGGVEGALIDCSFPANEYRVREERQGQNIVYVVAHTNSDANALRVARGGVAEFTGRCGGADGGIWLSGCALPKR